MEEKLQTLLDKLYEEGVAKGQQTANTVVQDAERKAAGIIEEAKREADALRRQAREESEEMRRNVVSELQLSSQQAIAALRQQISGLITTRTVGEPLQRAFSDEAFLKDIIKHLIDKWQPVQDGGGKTVLLLPADKEETLYRYFDDKARDLMDKGLEIKIDHRLPTGFRIGPADGGYVVSFTEEAFEAFFMDYLRPRTKELLYGTNE